VSTLNRTSAQLGYTMPFTRWKIWGKRQIKNRHTTKTKHNPEKQTTQNTAEQH